MAWRRYISLYLRNNSKKSELLTQFVRGFQRFSSLEIARKIVLLRLNKLFLKKMDFLEMKSLKLIVLLPAPTPPSVLPWCTQVDLSATQNALHRLQGWPHIVAVVWGRDQLVPPSLCVTKPLQGR
jgi:hypothetical protein